MKNPLKVFFAQAADSLLYFVKMEDLWENKSFTESLFSLLQSFRSDPQIEMAATHRQELFKPLQNSSEQKQVDIDCDRGRDGDIDLHYRPISSPPIDIPRRPSIQSWLDQFTRQVMSISSDSSLSPSPLTLAPSDSYEREFTLDF